MRKYFLLFILSLLSAQLYAQKLNGKQTFSNPGRYTEVNWSIGYKFEISGTEVVIIWSDPTITVAPTSYYNYLGTNYSKADLGISTWPESNQRPANMMVEIDVNYGDKVFKTVSNCGGTGQCKPGHVAWTHEIKNISISGFKVAQVTSMWYNGGGVDELDKRIANKKEGNQVTNSANKPQASNTPATSTPESSDYAKKPYLIDPATLTNRPAAPASNDKFSRTVDDVSKVVDATNAVVDLFTPSPEKLAQREKEKKAKELYIKNLEASAKVDFNTELYKHLSSANKGDENARMILAFSMQKSVLMGSGDFSYLIPDFKTWVKEAWANKNVDAMIFVGWNALNGIFYPMSEGMRIDFGLNKEQGVKILEEAANLGSKDAMYMLGIFYEKKEKCSYIKSFIGGNDAEKSMYWLMKASEKGSPYANDELGNIYAKNKYSLDVCQVKYSAKKDFFKALDFYWACANQSDDETSISMNFLDIIYPSVSKDPSSPLSSMYAEGLGCKKDEMTSRDLENFSRGYTKVKPKRPIQ
jgi:TPR repeat protein